MSGSIQDKMVKFIAERGDGGVGSEELAREFLAPASAPPALCEKLLANVLRDDLRVACSTEGVWQAVRQGSDSGAGREFTVIETCDVIVGKGRVPVEWAGARMDEHGRGMASQSGVIRPDAWPKDAVLPAHLRNRMSAGQSWSEAVAAVVEFARGTMVVSARPGRFQESVAQALVADDAPGEQLFLGRLARQILGAKIRTMEDIAGALQVPARHPESAPDRAVYIAELLSAVLSRRDELGFGAPDGWVERQKPKLFDVDFSGFDFDREFLDHLPARPGVYLMRDANGEVIYIGKAVDLRRRVADYFRARIRRDEKTSRIIERLFSLEIEETGSELAALLLEYQLIQELQPDINRQYDVHGRLAGQRAPSRRWVVVLPAVEDDEVEVFLFYGNRTLRRTIVPRTKPEHLREPLNEFFFDPNPPEPEAETELGWLPIAWSWLEQHRDAANAFDVELAGGLDETMRLLANYMREEASGARVYHV